MTLSDLKNQLEAELALILAPEFELKIVNTNLVPSIDDPVITYPNLVSQSQTCKSITTCILHVDIRNSTELGHGAQDEVMARLYSAFVRGMARCAEYYGGKVRNIIGDRLTVVFDATNCFTNAVNTAILMHSVSTYILDRYFTDDTIKCGIGIDHGTMLVAKVGIIKHGVENTGHKELVWLGGPANVASKLADQAHKAQSSTRDIVVEGIYYKYIREWSWLDTELKEFITHLKPTNSRTLVHDNENFDTYFFSTKTSTVRRSAILMTDAVYEGYKAANPSDNSIVNKWWSTVNLRVPGHAGKIYGGGVVFSVFDA